MKRIFSILILSLPLFVIAQNVAINNDGSLPHTNAILDVQGINKGLLIPRGDAATRTVLNTNTAKGLLLYDTINNTIWMHNGNGLPGGWMSLSTGNNYWQQAGALGTEIQNNNTGGFWSANASTVLIESLVQPPVSGSGTRLMWMPNKSAFRVGSVDGNDWNADSIGTWSIGLGFNARAKGAASVAIGTNTQATNYTSVAIGYGTKASGSISTALGENTTASGASSLSAGKDSKASGNYAIATGNGAIASGLNSFASGFLSTADGQNSFASGANTNARGFDSFTGNFNTSANGTSSVALGSSTSALGNSSFSMGLATKASGDNSFAIGLNTVARSYSSLAIGIFNDSVIASCATCLANNNPLLYIGNGTTDANRHNAMVVYQNGNMILKNPLAVSADPSGYTLPVTGTGTRMMWLPEKSAFRMGTVNGAQWDAANIALYSFAEGFNSVATSTGSIAMGHTDSATGNWSVALGASTVASGTESFAGGAFTNAGGDYSFAFGNGSRSSGFNSVAMGSVAVASGSAAIAVGNNVVASGNTSAAFGKNTIASGTSSAAWGDVTTASGTNSTANGSNTIASGTNSTAMGLGTVSKAFASVAIGRYNDSAALSKVIWNNADPILYVGNGSSDAARSNAMVILKNGNVGIGINTPATKLDVNGTTQTDSLQIGNGSILTKMEAGTQAVGTSATQLKQITITFPTTFTIVPKMNVTARNEPGTNNNDVYAVTVRSISASSAVINIFRIDVAGGWGQNLQLDWTAWTQ